jgi:DNA-binding winged helix-turn-helix (wHTH) protein
MNSELVRREGALSAARPRPRNEAFHDTTADRDDADGAGSAEHGDPRLSFGDFRLVPSVRLLLCKGVVVPLGGRAFDLLYALLLSRGAVVSKADIFRHVWPTTTVDESNLRFQVSRLRAALGKDRKLIKTVAGRGYLLAGEVGGASGPELAHAAVPSSATIPPEDLAQSYEALRSLLRSVLDELWQISLSREGAGRQSQAVGAGMSRSFARAAANPVFDRAI